MAVDEATRVRLLATVVMHAKVVCGNSLALAIGTMTAALSMLISDVEGTDGVTRTLELAISKLRELTAIRDPDINVEQLLADIRQYGAECAHYRTNGCDATDYLFQQIEAVIRAMAAGKRS